MSGGRMRYPLLGILAVLGIPFSAAEGTLDLQTDAEVSLQGAASVALSGGAALLDAAVATNGTWTFEIATGTLRIHESRSPGATFLRQAIRGPAEEREPEAFEVTNITLQFSAVDEPILLQMIPRETAEFIVEGNASTVGHPQRLEHEFRRNLRAGSEARENELVWKAGWWFVGDYAMPARTTGFPSWEAPHLRARGALLLEAWGGSVTFTTSSGTEVTRKLGTTTEGADTGTMSAGTLVTRWLVFEGQVLDASLPATVRWGIAAPTVSWQTEGETTWTRASGRADQGGEEVRFERATVQTVGSLHVLFRSLESAPPFQSWRYSATGDVTILVDGVVVGEATNPLAPSAARTGGILAFLVLLLATLTQTGRLVFGKMFVVAYTRLKPSEAFDHPTRARLWHLIGETPGMYLRELHRQSDVGWGTFHFHLLMLETMGHVRREKHGRYVAVFPSNRRMEDGPTIPHPLQRNVYDSLPPRGDPITMAQLMDATGLGRQHLRYHLNALQAKGLITVTAWTPLHAGTIRRLHETDGPADDRHDSTP